MQLPDGGVAAINLGLRLSCASLPMDSIKGESIDGILVHCNPGPNAGTTTTGDHCAQHE